MKLILDTNAYVGFKLGYSDIVDYLTRADVILMSPVVLGELMFGFRNGSRLNSNMEELDLFLSHPAVETIHISDVSSDRYSRIALQLKQQGTPIPSNDIWIAAQTLETGALPPQEHRQSKTPDSDIFYTRHPYGFLHKVSTAIHGGAAARKERAILYPPKTPISQA